jgi:hypothetical protein
MFFFWGIKMDTLEKLDELKKLALSDETVRTALLSTKHEMSPLDAFCKIATENGIELYPMDVVEVGEEMYSTMKRSTNGGGENAPVLDGQDDYYEMFLMEIS